MAGLIASVSDAIGKLRGAHREYPRHLAGRLFSVVVHSDVEGAENVRRSLSDWLRFMKLSPAGPLAELDRYIGYWKPYATSHEELDADKVIQEEVRNAARTLAEAVMNQRAGRRSTAGLMLEEPRPKMRGTPNAHPVDGPRPECPPVETTSLDQLSLAEAQCMRCPLYQDATQIVPGEGHRQARLMLVGREARRQGEPWKLLGSRSHILPPNKQYETGLAINFPTVLGAADLGTDDWT